MALRGVVACALVGATFLAVVPSSPAELPLGPRGLAEVRTTEVVAPGVGWTRIRRGAPGRGGPWRVNAIVVAPGVRVEAVLSNGLVAGREPLSAMAREAGAVAAVNGGFFGSAGAFDGDPVGALAVGGTLVSEPVAGRAALLLPAPGAGPPQVRRLRFAGSVAAGGRRRLLDGVNRARGLIAACGGRGGDRPTQRPAGALVCTDSSELVLYGPDFGRRTPASAGGTEVVVRAGVVSRRRQGGGTTIPADGYVLSGSGDAAWFLRSAAGPGAQPRVSLGLRGEGRAIDPAGFGAIVGGGPRLVVRGRVRVQPAREGFDAAFAGPNPRTLAGVRADGTLLLVTIDGRQPRWSVGITLLEAARVMRSFGARTALALDGGGSTTMTVGPRLVNRPSDGTQRHLSDAIVVAPR